MIKGYLKATLGGLLFGFIMGCLAMVGANEETTLLGLTQDHWYDFAALIGTAFTMPGVGLTWLFFNPPDGYYGDIWDNRIHIVILNSLFWTLGAHFVFCLIHVLRLLRRDWRSFQAKSHAR